MPSCFQIVVLVALLVQACLSVRTPEGQCESSRYAHKHRTFICTDISNEPDDQMSLVRLLTYANELDIQTIAIVTSTWKNDSLDTASVYNVLDGYGNVTANLNANVPVGAEYPTAGEMAAKVKRGHPVYGLAALNLTLSDAARALVNDTDESSTDDPLWVCLWGGANVVAEALHFVSRTRNSSDVAHFVEKLRVYSISDQDNAGAWLRVNYPKLFYIVALHGFNEYTQASWNGISGEQYRHFDKGGPNTSLITNDWLQIHIRVGDLGAHYLNYSYIMEGDTPSFFPLIQNGLGDPEHPEWGTWGGRFLLVDVDDRYPVYSDASDVAIGMDGDIYVSSFAGIWRWRKAYQYDFAARMQWTVNGAYSQNNHQPIAIVNGSCGPEVMEIPYKFNNSVVIDATESWDPDGDDLTFNWFHYREVVTRMQEGPISKVSLNVTFNPLDETGGLVRIQPLDNITMHIILSVEDERDMGLTTYRRIILTPTM
ncbi:DUF1593-domain-containing protein [Xylariaceae sp. FL0804]|nr:DUF1593-domain-containing protein [Xylariaceae sp. FL0804]